MKTLSMMPVPGQGWLSRSAAKTAYRLSDSELRLITRELTDVGAYCPRKGLALAAVDQVVQRLRSQS